MPRLKAGDGGVAGLPMLVSALAAVVLRSRTRQI
jgi:hypothetical protein